MAKRARLNSLIPLTFLAAAPAVALAEEPRRELSEEVQGLAERVSPAIVAFEVRSRPSQGDNLGDHQARGSGFLFTPEGHILTELVSVGNRRRVPLRMFGGVRARAKVVGRDPRNRIAVLKLESIGQVVERFEGGELPYLELGTALDLQPGHTVFNATNSFDSLIVDGQPAFSRGIVSYVGRLRDGRRYQGVVIETDASVNPGCFGGPLLDRSGRVVGVVSRGFSTRRWLGSAIPIDQVRVAVDAILAGQEPPAGFLGVHLRGTGGRATVDGLAVTRVADGSPAGEAGLEPGDRLLAIDGARVLDTGDVGRELAKLPAGSPVTLKLRRGDETRLVRVVIAAGEAPTAVAEAPTAEEEDDPRTSPPTAERPRTSIGVRIQERPQGGLLVTGVVEGGPAHAAGLREDDVILRLGPHRVERLADLRRALNGFEPGEQTTVQIERSGWSLEVELTLGGELTAEGPEPAPEPAPTGKPYLGVFVSPEAEAEGAPIAGLAPDSPAAKAGVELGDRIVAVDGRRIADASGLVEALQGKRPGDRLRLRVARDGRELALTVVLGARPDETPEPEPAPEPTTGPWLGVALAEDGGRLVIDEVAPGSPAGRAGFEAGDVVLRAGGTPVRSLEAFGRLLGDYGVGDELRLLIERDGWEKEFTLTLARRP